MSNELMNVYCRYGCPDGDDLGIFEVAEWGAERIKELEAELAKAHEYGYQYRQERNRAEAELAALKSQKPVPPAQPPSQGGEAVEVVASIAVDAEGVVRDFTLEPGLDRHPGGYTVTSLMTVAQHKRILAAQPQNNGVMVPRAIAERMAIDAAQYEHEHAVVNDNVQLWQQPSARLTLTVGDLRTVRALLGGEA